MSRIVGSGGGGGGIGSAVVRRFVSEGAKVAVADIFADSAKAAAAPHGDAAIALQSIAETVAQAVSIAALDESTSTLKINITD